MTELQEKRLAQILDEYLAERRAGRAAAPDELLRKHPELAGDLADCLSCLEMVECGFDDLKRGEKGAPEELPGGILGDFRIIREVGRGGMGVVYEAEQISLGRRVALKVLPFAAVFDDRQLQRFKNEAQAAAFLHHTNIVPVHAVGQERGVHYYAMQFIEGRSLAQIVEELKRGPLEPSQPLSVITKGRSTQNAEYCRAVAQIGTQAAEALAHAHERGVVHRDIKPANLMVDPLGHLWVTDFGLASFQRSDSNLTLTGDLLGTVRYMSPEQALAKRVPVDHRTDVYSLGVTLYELLTLEPAFPGSNVQEVMEAIAFREPVLARTLNPAIPVDLETVLLKSMAKDPSERYGDAESLRADLVRYLEDKPIRARRPSWFVRIEKWAKRHRSLVAAGLVSLFIILIGLVWMNVRVSGAYREADQQRQRAELDFARARRAVRQMLAQAGAEDLEDVPLMEPVRRSLLESAIAFYEDWLDEAGGDPDLRAEVAEAYEDLADVRKLLGDSTAAEEQYSRALEFAALPADRARIWHRLGLVHELQGNLEGADSALQKALGVRRAGDPLDWAATMSALARVAGRRGDAGREARYRDSAIELLEKETSTQAKFELARTLGTLARGQFEGRRDESAVSAARALELLRDIAGAPNASRAHRQQLGRALADRANVSLELGERAQSAEGYREALEVLDPLAREFPFLPNVRHLQCGARAGLGRSLIGKASVPEFREAVRGGEELLILFPASPDRERSLAIYHMLLAPAIHREEPETAQLSFQRSERILRDLITRFEDEAGYVRDLSSLMFNHSNTLPFPENVRRVREASEVLRPLYESDPDRATFRNPVATFHNQAGGYFWGAGRLDEAAGEYLKAIELRRDRTDLDARRGLARALMNLGLIRRNQKRFAEAEIALQESMKVGDEIRDERPTHHGARAGSGLCRLHLGDTFKLTGRLKLATDIFREAVLIFEELVGEGSKDLVLLADANHSLGRASELHLGAEDANSLTAKGRAIEVRQQYVEENPDRNGQRDRLATEAHLLANAYRKLGRPEEVERHFRLAKLHREYLVLHAKNKPLFRSQLAWGLHDFADFLVSTDDAAAARPLVDRAVALQQHAVADRPKKEMFRARLMSHFDLLAGVAEAQRDHAGVSDAARQMAAFKEGSWEAHSTAADKYSAAVALILNDKELAEAERMTLARERYIRAVRELRRAIELRKNDGSLHRRLAWTLAVCPFDELLALDAAEESGHRGVALGDARAHQALAIAAVRGRRWNDAVTQLEQSMKHSGGGDQYDWYCVAVIKASRGDTGGGQIAYRKAISLAEARARPDAASRLLRALARQALGVLPNSKGDGAPDAK